MAEETQIENREGEAFDASGLVGKVAAALDAGAPDVARALVADLRPRDLADVIALLAPPSASRSSRRWDRRSITRSFPSSTGRCATSSEELPNEFLAKVVTELDTDDAAYLLENLEEADRQEILRQLPKSDRAALERNLEYPEETAGRIMQADFVAVAPFWTVGQVIDFMRETEDLPEAFSEIFVVDPSFRVLGSVELSRLLRSKREVRVDAIMNTDRHVVLATADQEEVARQFERYDLMSAPVVDENRRLVGVVTVDDVVEVIQDEADEDMRALGGVGDEDLADTVLRTSRSRIPWLVVNLFTAMIASLRSSSSTPRSSRWSRSPC